MKASKKIFSVVMALFLAFTWSIVKAGGQGYSSNGDDDPNKKIIKNGVLGAVTGAVAAGGSGGKAGKGALIGAGTNVIGGALLDSLSGSGSSQQQQPQYVPVQSAPQTQYVQQPQYTQQTSYPVQPQGYRTVAVEQQPVYVQQPVYYQQPPQEDPNKKIIKNGLLGAATGAIAASASGGKAGKGALIGAGTNVIGGALLDSFTGSGSSQQPQPVYVQQAPQYQYQQQAAPQSTRRVTYYKTDAQGNTLYDSHGNPVIDRVVEESQ